MADQTTDAGRDHPSNPYRLTRLRRLEVARKLGAEGNDFACWWVEWVDELLVSLAAREAECVQLRRHAGFGEARAAGFAAGQEAMRERCAEFIAAKSAKIADDAKTIPLGAPSFRATLFASCPAWDVEQYVARIVAEDAAAIRAIPMEERP